MEIVEKTGGKAGIFIVHRIVFQYTYKVTASHIIPAHNHPSCNLKPGIADLSITRQIKNRTKQPDINLPDHLIIIPDEKISFAVERDLIIPYY